MNFAEMLRGLADRAESGELENITFTTETRSALKWFGNQRINQPVTVIEVTMPPDVALYGTDGVTEYNPGAVRSADELIAKYGFHPAQVVQRGDGEGPDAYFVCDLIREVWYQAHWAADRQAGIDPAVPKETS